MFYRILSLTFIVGFSLSACADSPNAPIVLKSPSGACIPTPEICGDGIDQDCDGSDAVCPGVDKDRDGFTTNDCDDYNRKVYPGIAVECQASCGTGTQTCQADGRFSACSCEPLCEAKGTGKCYYISRLTGNDTNSGTFASPWRSYRNIISYYADNQKPGRWAQLKAGDAVYFMSGVYDDTVLYDKDLNGISIALIKATSTAPVQLKAYPGASVILAPKDRAKAIRFYSSSNFIVEGFEVVASGIRLEHASDIEIRNCWVHETDGVDNNNIAGISALDSLRLNIHHSMINDNYDRTCQDTGGVKTENSRNIVLFGGGNVRIHHNVIFQTPPISAPKTGACVVYKHGQAVPGGIFEVDNNIMWNCYFAAIGTGTYGGRFHHNLILNSDYAVSVRNHGGVTGFNDNIAELNTIVNTPGLVYNPTEALEAGSTFGMLVFRGNIVINRGTFNADTGGIIVIDRYGPNSTYDRVVGSQYLAIDQNCYYNPGGDVYISFYSSNDTPIRSLGSLYNFSNWQQQGYDRLSFALDPRLDSNFTPQASQCARLGHYTP